MLTVIVGLCTYQDYGISWDEPIQREMGEVSYNYIFNNDPKLLTYIEKDHGVAFEVPLILIERAIDTKTSLDVYLMRHLVGHLFFLLCCFSGYVLVQNLFKKQWLSSLAFLMLVFHPRIYAHSFFNSKDVPLLGLFVVCFMLAEIAFRKDKRWIYVLLGLAIGYASSIRILGIILLGPVMLFFLFDIISKRKDKHASLRIVSHAFALLLGACISLYITFPTLWPSPVRNFIAVFESLSHFRWENGVVFMGRDILSTQLPFYYLPVWMGISTPVIWLLAGIAGPILLIFRLVKQPLLYVHNRPERNYLLYFFCFIFPLLMIILLGSVVYDDWRHVYFVYPAFVLLGIYALNKLSQFKVKPLILVLCIIQLVDVGVYMVRSHPHQQVYFNYLVSHKPEYLRKNYDFDYWGSSCKQGLEYILANDTSSKVRIFESLAPVYYASIMLTQQQKERIQFVDRNDFPYYFITNFRGHTDDYMPPEVSDVFYEEKVLNSTIMRVYRCR